MCNKNIEISSSLLKSFRIKSVTFFSETRCSKNTAMNSFKALMGFCNNIADMQRGNSLVSVLNGVLR